MSDGELSRLLPAMFSPSLNTIIDQDLAGNGHSMI